MLDSKYEALLRRNCVEALYKYVDTDVLRSIYKEQFGKECTIDSKLKLARLLKQRFVSEYCNSDIDVLLDNISVFDSIHCITFQRNEMLDDLMYEGIYVPSERFASEPATTRAVKKTLGYYPIWLVNPLMLGQCRVDKDAFTLLPFINRLQSAFPMHRYDIGEDFVMLEFKFDRAIITSYNSSNICTCLPMVKMSELVGVYKFYMNDRDCGYINTCRYPYIKVVKTFSLDAMCLSDYESAITYDTYTGTESDYE